MTGVIISLLTVILAIVSLLIVVIVLMQRPKQEGLGAAFGGGMTDQMFGAQTSNVLQKGTVWLAVAFFVITLVLSILMARSKPNTVPDSLKESDPLPAQSTPGAGAVSPGAGITIDPNALNEGGIDVPSVDLEATPAVPMDGLMEPASPEPAPGDAKAKAEPDAKPKAKENAKPKAADAKPKGDGDAAKPAADAKDATPEPVAP